MNVIFPKMNTYIKEELKTLNELRFALHYLQLHNDSPLYVKPTHDFVEWTLEKIVGQNTREKLIVIRAYINIYQISINSFKI